MRVSVLESTILEPVREPILHRLLPIPEMISKAGLVALAKFHKTAGALYRPSNCLSRKRNCAISTKALV